MAYHLGRLIDHVHLAVRDLPRSKNFYLAIFEALGVDDRVKAGGDWLEIDELFIDSADGGGPVSHVHLCFQVADRATVDRFHAAGLAGGGRDNGAPGLRDYHPGYYAAYLLDPDGNNIEAKLDERRTTRSADSVQVDIDPRFGDGGDDGGGSGQKPL